MIREISSLLDEVAVDANTRKIEIGVAYGYSAKDMKLYLSDAEYRKKRNDIGSHSLNWFRKRKNQDIKDKFLLAGISKKYCVRAEKTMGAKPEYQKQVDQDNYNRFDLSWEKSTNSKDFALAMEIEMDMEHKEILRDFKKLLMNKKTDYKVMVCQTKTEGDLKPLLDKCSALVKKNASNGGNYLISAWVWELGKFVHYPMRIT